MPTVHACTLPRGTLLAAYQDQGAYTDCYVTQHPGQVSHAAFVEAFYTTRLFKLERFILTHAVAKPSTDAQARELAQGGRDAFAAWTVQGRTETEVLLRDYQGATCSWLMVAASEHPGASHTRLYFGSAIVPRRRDASGKPRLSVFFWLLLGFHKGYSRALLSSAQKRLANV
jgi:hypothetical protein